MCCLCRSHAIYENVVMISLLYTVKVMLSLLYTVVRGSPTSAVVADL